MGRWQVSDQACVLPHREDPDRPRPVWVGFLCRGHVDGLYRTLSELSTFAGQADRASYAETVSVNLSAPTTGTREKPLPVNLLRLEHVIQVRGVLASWAQMVAEERNVAVPDDPDPRVTSGFLRRHLDFCCQQAWADEMATEILELGRRAWSLLNPSGIRRIEIGRCHEQDEDEDGLLHQCAGTLSALVRKSDDLLPSSIRCDSCGVEITADRWLTYGRQINEEAA